METVKELPNIKNAAEILEKAVKETDIQNINPNPNLNSFFNKLMNNKNYIYVLLIVIVLAIIGYYLYIKYFNKKFENKTKPTPNNPTPLNNQAQQNNQKKEEPTKQILNTTGEYYILDNTGNPILLTPYFNDIIKHNTNKQQPPVPRPPINSTYRPRPPPPSKPPPPPPTQPQKNLPKQTQQPDSDSDESSSEITIPKQIPIVSSVNDTSHIPENVMLTDAEDDNITNQDLTNDEIVELKRQLELMQKNQKYQVTAQNDED